MSILYLHIGAHKTASTYIQKWCSENVSALIDAGLAYPEAGRSILFGHHEFAQLLRSGGDITNAAEALRKELHNARGDVLLSSENFEYMQPDQIRSLIAMSGMDKAKVIFFYRNWTQLLYAMWQEEIKHGQSMSYHEYCIRHVAFPFSSNLLNFIGIADRFASVVGTDNMMVASYDALVAKGDILRQFLKFVRPDHDFTIVQETVNRSFGPATAECIRALNAIMTLRGHNRGYQVKHHFQNSALLGTGQARFDRLAGIMERYLTTSHDFSGCFAARSFFERFLREFRNMMVDDQDLRVRHVNAPSEPASVIHQDYLLEPEVPALLESFVPSLEKALAGQGSHE